MIWPSAPPDTLALRLVIGAVIGPILGSFATMLSHRLPRGLSIVAPPSRCPSCGTRLAPRDLVPILSWMIQRGRCRHCRAPIGGRYIAIEAAATTLVMATFALVGFSPLVFPALAAIVLAVTLCAIRIERGATQNRPPS